MANIKRANTSGITKTGTAVPDVVDAPTIGTATAGVLSATVAFTPAASGGTATSYTAISTPSSITASGASSPISVTNLAAGTAYTFQVYGSNASGTWSNSLSAASNSITPTDPSATYFIQRTTASGGESSITFSGIPSTYKNLQIRILARDTWTTPSGYADLLLQFNSDTGSNYSYHLLRSDGSTISSAGNSSQTYIRPEAVSSYSGSSNTLTYGAGVIDIVDYGSTSKYKTVRCLGGVSMNASTGGRISMTGGQWRSTSAISSIKFSPVGDKIAAGTTFAIYGIAG